jgi:predicted transcriptional regulator
MLSFFRKYKLFKTKDPKKQAIIDLLKEKDHCTYGEIIKRLSISSTSGIRYINELKNEGIISNKIMPPFYKLAGDYK